MNCIVTLKLSKIFSRQVSKPFRPQTYLPWGHCNFFQQNGLKLTDRLLCKANFYHGCNGHSSFKKWPIKRSYLDYEKESEALLEAQKPGAIKAPRRNQEVHRLCGTYMNTPLGFLKNISFEN